MRIVYVEDNPTNALLVERVANAGKHQVIHYTDGESALAHYPDDLPDFLLVDVQLSGALDGLDVVRELRAAGETVPIFALTAYAMKGDEVRCLAAGCDGYLAKPVDIVALMDLFDTYAARR